MHIPKVSPTRIKQLIEEDYDPTLLRAWRQAWQLTLRHKWRLLGLLGIYFLIILVLRILLLVGDLVNLLVFQPLAAAILVWAYYSMYTHSWREFGDIFTVLRKEVWQRFLSVYLLQWLIFFLVFTPSLIAFKQSGILDIYFAENQDIEQLTSLYEQLFHSSSFTIILLNLIPAIYLMVSYSFAYMHALFVPELSPWQCLEQSRQLITRHWSRFFGYYATIFFALMAGTMLVFFIVQMDIDIAIWRWVSITTIILWILFATWLLLSVQGGLVIAFAKLTHLGQDDDSSSSNSNSLSAGESSP